MLTCCIDIAGHFSRRMYQDNDKVHNGDYESECFDESSPLRLVPVFNHQPTPQLPLESQHMLSCQLYRAEEIVLHLQAHIIFLI